MKRRRCRRCGPVAYRKERPPGAVRSRFICLSCGGPTRRLTKRQPKAERSPGKVLLDRADLLWRTIIKWRAGARPQTVWMGQCQRCGCYRALQAAHNIGRGKSRATRCDLDNGAALCAGCHQTIDQVADEKRAFFRRFLGDERYERLELVRQSRARVDIQLVVLQLEAVARKEGVTCPS